MLRGYYNAAQGMLVKQRELDTISNNLANVNTAGYKKDEAVVDTFQRELVLIMQRRAVSGKVQQTYVKENITNLEQSNLDYTENPLDLGIYGNMYFNVRVPENATWAPNFDNIRAAAVDTNTRAKALSGMIYEDASMSAQFVKRDDVTDETGYQNPPGETLLTRCGQFELDGDGYLAYNDGAGKSMRVQGTGGDIYIGTDNIEVDVDGVVYTYNPDDPQGQRTEIAQLQLTYVPPAADVQKIGNNVFRYDGGEAMPAGERFQVIQGAFEKSNVDPNKEITKAMAAQRLYEANSKVLIAFNAINDRASRIASSSQ